MGLCDDYTWLLPYTCDVALIMFLMECAVLALVGALLVVAGCAGCFGACYACVTFVQKDLKENAYALEKKHPDQEAQDAAYTDALEKAVEENDTCSV